MDDQTCITIVMDKEVYQGIIVALVALDHWLGVTDKVKASSLLSLIFPFLQPKEKIEPTIPNGDK